MDEPCRLDRRMQGKAAAPALWLSFGTMLFAGGVVLLLMVPAMGDIHYASAPWGVSFYLAYAQAALAAFLGITVMLGGILGWRQHDVVSRRPSSVGPLRAAAKALFALAAAVLLPGIAVTVDQQTMTDYWEFGAPVAAAILVNAMLMLRLARPPGPRQKRPIVVA